MNRLIILATALICLAAQPVRAEDNAADFYEGTVNGHSLACIDIATATCLAASDSKCFPASFDEVVRTGRCVWWQDGDKVIVSPRDHGPEVIAVRHADGSRWLFIDMSFITRDGCDMNELARYRYHVQGRCQ